MTSLNSIIHVDELDSYLNNNVYIIVCEKTREILRKTEVSGIIVKDLNEFERWKVEELPKISDEIKEKNITVLQILLDKEFLFKISNYDKYKFVEFYDFGFLKKEELDNSFDNTVEIIFNRLTDKVYWFEDYFGNYSEGFLHFFTSEDKIKECKELLNLDSLVMKNISLVEMTYFDINIFQNIKIDEFDISLNEYNRLNKKILKNNFITKIEIESLLKERDNTLLIFCAEDNSILYVGNNPIFFTSKDDLDSFYMKNPKIFEKKYNVMQVNKPEVLKYIANAEITPYSYIDVDKCCNTKDLVDVCEKIL